MQTFYAIHFSVVSTCYSLISVMFIMVSVNYPMQTIWREIMTVLIGVKFSEAFKGTVKFK